MVMGGGSTRVEDGREKEGGRRLNRALCGTAYRGLRGRELAWARMYVYKITRVRGHAGQIVSKAIIVLVCSRGEMKILRPTFCSC